MKISVIIPSYNPELKLPHTLDLLASQHKLIDELIVVADKKNYSDTAKAMLEKYARNFNLKIVVQEISGRGRSRNKGAESSTGDLLLFLDDDMLVEKDLIARHIQYHTENPGIIVSGHGYRNPLDADYDFGKYLVKMEKSWKRNFNVPGEITFKKINFTSQNMSLPKKIFQQLDGFDTRLPDSEDFDFAVRALHNGIRIIYDITLLAWHNDWPNVKAFLLRLREYRNSKKTIYSIHPGYAREFPQLQKRIDSKSKKLLATVFKSPLIWFVGSGNIIFTAMPMKVKFKLYDLAIAFNAITNNY